MSGVAVVGAGIAGIRAAEALRSGGYRDQITIIGDESPVYRPSISKEALGSASALEFPLPLRRSSTDFDWLTDTRVESARLGEGVLSCSTSSGGSFELSFTGLVIASGLRPRVLDVPGPTQGRLRLRTLGDASALRSRLTEGARVTIIGSGFIGCEVAAAARRHGCLVTVISPEAVPLASSVGDSVGRMITKRHEEAGVHFMLERSVREYAGDSAVREVLLDDGQVLATDLVLEAVGSTPNTAWLGSQGLDISDGVLADEHLRAIGTQTPVVAGGDVARHPNALFPGAAHRIEHWTASADSGGYAGRALGRLLETGDIDLAGFAALPSFWSDQYDMHIQSFGLPHLAREQRIVEQDASGSCIVECHDGQRLVAVVGINRTAELAGYRKLLASSV